MTREEALRKAIEFKVISEEFESVSFMEGDTEFFEYIIKELEGTAPEITVQEQSVNRKRRLRNNIKKRRLFLNNQIMKN